VSVNWIGVTGFLHCHVHSGSLKVNFALRIWLKRYASELHAGSTRLESGLGHLMYWPILFVIFLSLYTHTHIGIVSQIWWRPLHFMSYPIHSHWSLYHLTPYISIGWDIENVDKKTNKAEMSLWWITAKYCMQEEPGPCSYSWRHWHLSIYLSVCLSMVLQFL
jgi:hypothetical protein